MAVQVAGELVPEFADGVWLVELAPVGDPVAVADAVASVLGVAPRPGLSVSASVAQALSGRRLLVVLDNCEHVLDAVAELVDTVLSRTSGVKVLATSREGLRVAAEHLWPVPSLDGGDAGSAAVELFVDRARAVTPGFALRDDADSAAVVEICRRLDGLPLAIELAAARMVSMHPAELRDRLGDRFRLLATVGAGRNVTRRCVAPWAGPMTCSARTNATSCSGARCSPEGSTWQPQSRCALSGSTSSGVGCVGFAGPQVAGDGRGDARAVSLRVVGNDPPVRPGPTRRDRRR